MDGPGAVMLAVTLLLSGVFLTGQVKGQVLSPPYHNLAEGKPVQATATCGEDVSERELFCELTGAHPNVVPHTSHHVIQGQVCDYCDPTFAQKAHPASQAVDGTERWWQSPPLSRGLNFNEVNFSIPFGQVGCSKNTFSKC